MYMYHVLDDNDILCLIIYITVNIPYLLIQNSFLSASCKGGSKLILGDFQQLNNVLPSCQVVNLLKLCQDLTAVFARHLYAVEMM